MGIQHWYAPRPVSMHPCVYENTTTPMNTNMFTGEGDESRCDVALYQAYRLVFGAGAWMARMRVEMAVDVRALWGCARAFRIQDCKCLNLVIVYIEKRKCGLKNVALKYPLKFVGFIAVGFKEPRDERMGLARVDWQLRRPMPRREFPTPAAIP